MRLFCKLNPASPLCRRKPKNRKPKEEEEKEEEEEKCRLPLSTVEIVHKLRKLVRHHKDNPTVKCLRKLIFHVLSVKYEEAEKC